MQLTLSLFLAGLAVGQLICGPISDRVGRRRPLLFGSAAFAIASVICAFTRSIEALILARFVMGLAGATGMVIARAVVRDSFEEADSARIYSLLDARHRHRADHLPLGRQLADGDLGLGLDLLALAAFACLCGVAVAVDLPETHPPDRRTRDTRRHARPSLYRDDRRPPVHGLRRPGRPGAGHRSSPMSRRPRRCSCSIYGLSPNAFSLLFAANAIGLIGVRPGQPMADPPL